MRNTFESNGKHTHIRPQLFVWKGSMFCSSDKIKIHFNSKVIQHKWILWTPSKQTETMGKIPHGAFIGSSKAHFHVIAKVSNWLVTFSTVKCLKERRRKRKNNQTRSNSSAKAEKSPNSAYAQRESKSEWMD